MKLAVYCVALALLALSLSINKTYAQANEEPNPSAGTVSVEPSDAEQSSEQLSGSELFDRMQLALRQLNFDASMVHVRGGRVELYRWLHGRMDDGQEMEVLVGLNGPEYRVLRQNNHVSYYHSMGSPYSMRASIVNGPLPAGFFEPFANIENAYNVVAVGGGRVLGRASQHIRVVAQDRQRYGYSVWVDRETGMLLRAATLSVDGDVLEQVQLTNLFISDRLLQPLEEVQEVSRPPLVDDTANRRPVEVSWRIGWLPQGFTQVRANHHRMAVTGQPVDYFLYTDGLAKVSVYVGRSQQPLTGVSIEGAESMYATQLDEFQVTVVGSVPMETARRIAQSVRHP